MVGLVSGLCVAHSLSHLEVGKFRQPFWNCSEKMSAKAELGDSHRKDALQGLQHILNRERIVFGASGHIMFLPCPPFPLRHHDSRKKLVCWHPNIGPPLQARFAPRLLSDPVIAGPRVLDLRSCPCFRYAGSPDHRNRSVNFVIVL